VFVEYAKADVEDILVRVSVANRGPHSAQLHVLPTVWFRNTWSWDHGTESRPSLSKAGASVIQLDHAVLGRSCLFCEGEPELLFTENETNTQRLFNAPNATPYVKDAINDCVVHGAQEAVNPAQVGTKGAANYR
jgi:hypothetical protein